MKRDEALKLFDEKAWDTSDKAVKEVTRYQSNPGQASAYMIGQLKIWQIRNETKAKIEANRKIFSEKDFHYQILSQGSSPGSQVPEGRTLSSFPRFRRGTNDWHYCQGKRESK